MNTASRTKFGEYTLVQIALPAVAPQPTTTGVHHLMVVDVSGSMSSDLPQLRKDLKSLNKQMSHNDRMSIVWFSGRSQCGVLFENEELSTAADLERTNKAIDRWIVPVGMTGFYEPLELIGRVAKQSPLPTSLIFMSDGWDNQSSRPELLTLVAKLASDKTFNAVAVVEYGYYADRALLAEIATRLGGSHIFASNINFYRDSVEDIVFTTRATPKVDVKIDVDAIGGFVFDSYDDTYSITDGMASVPSDTSSLFALTGNSDAPPFGNAEMLAAAYVAAKLYLLRAEPKIVHSILAGLGDVYFIEQFSRCFGKQAYSKLAGELQDAVEFPGKRYQKGYNPSVATRDDLITIIDLFNALGEDDRIRLNFEYNRIGRKAEAVDFDQLLAEAAASHATEQTEETKQAILKLARDASVSLNFVPDTVDGYKIDGLVMPESRANLSFRIKQWGVVKIANPPAEFATRLPAEIRSFRYRNYAVLKDGLVNIDAIQILVSEATKSKIVKWILSGRIDADLMADIGDGFVGFNLSGIPISNRISSTPVTPQALFELEYDLLQAQAAAKVWSYAAKSNGDAVTPFAEAYGADVADWLKSHGLTAGGWSPNTRRAESTDAYMARELYTRIKGFSALPSVAEVKRQMAAGKVGKAAKLMETYLNELQDLKCSDLPVDEISETIDDLAKHARKWVKIAQSRLCKIKFAMILNGTWLAGCTMEQTQFDIELGGETHQCTIEQRMIEVPI